MQLFIYEDNAACLKIANDITSLTGPCTHHLSIKWHHFKDQICSRSIQVEKVDTLLNWADIFTKPLSVTQFHALCKILLGRWPCSLPHWWSWVWGSRGSLAWLLSPNVVLITSIMRECHTIVRLGLTNDIVAVMPSVPGGHVMDALRDPNLEEPSRFS